MEESGRFGPILTGSGCLYMEVGGLVEDGTILTGGG